MELHRHPLPQAITSIADLRLFMEHHVFAVWDFMLLLKSLQQHLAPSVVPWVPPRHPEIAGLVNSLVGKKNVMFCLTALESRCISLISRFIDARWWRSVRTPR